VDYGFLKRRPCDKAGMAVIRLSVHPDPEATAVAAAELIADWIAAAQSARGVAHVSLAGGTTPRRTYELLAARLREPERVDWWFGDERCVPADDPESNYRMVSESLIAGGIPAERVHRVDGEEPPERAAAAYAGELAREIPLNADDVPVLDVALLGLGEDGHTASLFPGDAALGVTDALVVPVVAVKPPPNRITLTFPVLRAARDVIVLATGVGKRDAVTRVLAGPDPHTPASLLAAANVTLAVDEAAAP
jgi:6-phosphogluconolactonase